MIILPLLICVNLLLINSNFNDIEDTKHIDSIFNPLHTYDIATHYMLFEPTGYLLFFRSFDYSLERQ